MWKSGAYWTGLANEVRWEARAIGYHNQVRELIVFACDADFNCAPQNVDRATLEGATLGLNLFWRDTRVGGFDRPGQSLERRHRESFYRDARGHTGAVQVLQQAGPVQLGLEFIASSLRYDDAANTVKMGGYGIVNLTAEWPFAKRVVVAQCAATTCSTRTTSWPPILRRAGPRFTAACAGSRDARIRDDATSWRPVGNGCRLRGDGEVAVIDDAGQR
jgi:hypothetical protein